MSFFLGTYALLSYQIFLCAQKAPKERIREIRTESYTQILTTSQSFFKNWLVFYALNLVF